MRHRRTGRSRTRSPARRAIVKGKVLIGNGGAEFGVRGYVSAYDADDRQARLALLHRARRPVEAVRGRRSCRRPRATWNGEWWKLGGGGTVWDSMAYDPGARPALHRHRQRLSVEPAPPQSGRRRQPVSLLDRRAASRIPANTSGTTRPRPARPWDYTATQHIILADLTIDGAAAQGADAGAEERLLLCARSHEREAALGAAVHDGQLGHGRRHEDRPAGRESRRALWRHATSRGSRCRDRSARTTGSRCRSARRRTSSTSRRRTFPSRTAIPRRLRPTRSRSTRASIRASSACREERERQGAGPGVRARAT